MGIKLWKEMKIEVLENGFLVRMYVTGNVARVVYAATLEDLFDMIERFYRDDDSSS